MPSSPPQLTKLQNHQKRNDWHLCEADLLSTAATGEPDKRSLLVTWPGLTADLGRLFSNFILAKFLVSSYFVHWWLLRTNVRPFETQSARSNDIRTLWFRDGGFFFFSLFDCFLLMLSPCDDKCSWERRCSCERIRMLFLSTSDCVIISRDLSASAKIFKRSSLCRLGTIFPETKSSELTTSCTSWKINAFDRGCWLSRCRPPLGSRFWASKSFYDHLWKRTRNSFSFLTFG